MGALYKTTIRLESDVHGLKTDVGEIRTSIAAQDVKLDKVAGQAGDLTTIKRIAAVALTILAPYVAWSVRQSIVGTERLEQVKQTHAAHIEGPLAGHRQTERDIATIRADVRVMRTEERTAREATQRTLEQVQDSLEKIHREGVPRRRDLER